MSYVFFIDQIPKSLTFERAQNTTTTLPANTWTQLTDADITSATFQNNSGNVIFITGTAGAVAPTSLLGAIVLHARAHSGRGRELDFALDGARQPRLTSSGQMYARWHAD